MGDIALLYVACFALDMHITHTHRTYPMYITQQHTLPGTATDTHTTHIHRRWHTDGGTSLIGDPRVITGV